MNYRFELNENDEKNLSDKEYYEKLLTMQLCPYCRGTLVARKNKSNNETFLACSNYY